jgi:23S rRNA (guanosine2251-2'-O)-methyltransferase
MHSILILENIRSAQNVGAIFRTADGAGVSKIYLVGITPTPLDRFGRKRGDIAKAALGAEETVPWEYKKLTRPLLQKLKRDGYQIISLEQDVRSKDYKKIKPKKKFALIVGAEVTGIDKKTLEESDIIAEIPMKGKKESLNVSVSLGIALYRLCNL